MTVEEPRRDAAEGVPHDTDSEAPVGSAPFDPAVAADDASAEETREGTAGAADAGAAADGSAAGDAAADDAAGDAVGDATAGAADADADAEAGAAADATEPARAESENPYLEDLRRLTAEYANYRKRTEENAEIERLRAAGRVITPLLAVLDDLDRAEQHGDLAEGSAFAQIAQKLRTLLEKQGLVRFGETGEPFDPQRHEAIAKLPVPGTEGEVVMDVVEVGYRLNELELRPAKVAVAVSADG